MNILGIDPGTTRMGFGVVSSESGLKYIDCGVIGYEKGDSIERLVYIGRELEKKIKAYNPGVLGVEKIFFSKNSKTAISVAEARGVVLYIAGSMGIPVLEFSPSDVKRVVAGYGACDKKTLEKVVIMTLGIDSVPHYDDASDALALAIRTSFDIKL